MRQTSSRLPVHQDRRAGVARRVEVGQPLGRRVAVEQDVDDDVAAFVARAFELQAERFAHGAAPPSRATSQSACSDSRPSRVASVEPHAVAVALEPRRAGSASGCRSARGGGSAGRAGCSMLYCCRLTIGGSFWFSSCGIVKCGTSVRRGSSCVPPVQGSPSSRNAGGRAEPVEDLETAPRDADGAAARRHRVVGLDHDRAHAVPREAERGA